MSEPLTIDDLKARLRERLLNASAEWREQWFDGLLCLQDQADDLFKEMEQTAYVAADAETEAGLETVGLCEMLCTLVLEVADEDQAGAWWRTPEWVERRRYQAIQDAYDAAFAHNLDGPRYGRSS